MFEERCGIKHDTITVVSLLFINIVIHCHRLAILNFVFSTSSTSTKGGQFELLSQSRRRCLSVRLWVTLFLTLPKDRPMFGVITHFSNLNRRTTWIYPFENIPYTCVFTPSRHKIPINLAHISLPSWVLPPPRSSYHPISSGFFQGTWTIILIQCSHLTSKVEYIVHFFLFLCRPIGLHGMLIVGLWGSNTQTEAKRTLDSVPI